MNGPVARLVAAGLVACTMLGGASIAQISAAPSLKTYSDKAHHFSFQYPATWKLAHASLGATEKSIGITGVVAVGSPDSLAGFGIAVKPSPSTTGKLKAAAGALLKEGVTVVGTISYDTKPNANGLPSVTATASVKFDATHIADEAVVGVSTSTQTLYILGYGMTKPAASSADLNEYTAITHSFKSS